MNKHLKSFLQSYLDWAILGAPEVGSNNPNRFVRAYALCDNLSDQVRRLIRNNDMSRGAGLIIQDELEALFADDDLDTNYPFGEKEFHHECAMRTHHTNEDRIDWIRKQLEK